VVKLIWDDLEEGLDVPGNVITLSSALIASALAESRQIFNLFCWFNTIIFFNSKW
jgi:hypothetical protein